MERSVSYWIRIFTRVALVLAVAVWSNALKAAGELSGASAFGSADFLYQPCVTFACEPTAGNWSTDSDGGTGAAIAAAGGPGGVNGDHGYAAFAQLAGPNALPVLRAFAQAVTEPGTFPGYSSDCCYLNSTLATAKAIQYYTYTGTTPTEYTLTFEVDGTFNGVRATMNAGISLFDGQSGNLEIPLGGFIDGASVSLDTSVQGPFHKSGSVSVALDPGEGFYVSSFLNINVPREGEAVVDVSHTFTTSFTAGDPSLLTPTLAAAVPEPAALWQMLAGLIALCVAGRRVARLNPRLRG